MSKSKKRRRSDKRNKKRKQRAEEPCKPTPVEAPSPSERAPQKDETSLVIRAMDQLIVDMAGRLSETKKHVASAIADEKSLAKQAEFELSKAAEWERRATMATRAGDEVLAEEAMERKREHDKLATGHRRMWKHHKHYVDRLKMALSAINRKIAVARRRKQALVRQIRALDAREQLATATYGVERTLALMDALAAVVVGEELPVESSDDLCPMCAAQFPSMEAALAAARAGAHAEAAERLAEIYSNQRR